MANWVYVRSEGGVWTVGFYDPDGKWQPESDHDSPGEAAARVHWLNGGKKALGSRAAAHPGDGWARHVLKRRATWAKPRR